MTGPCGTLLVTGASGFVGRALLKHLGRAGYEGIASSRTPLDLLPGGWYWSPRDAMLSAVPKEGINSLVHLEVKQHVLAPTRIDLDKFDAINVGGTASWLQWAAQNKVHRFVHFSSIKAVNSGANAPVDESAMGPGDTPYGASKWRGEEAVRRWCAEDSSRIGIILRPAVIYGPGNQANIFAMLDALAKGQFFLVGSGGNIKSLVSIDNLTAAVRYLLDWTKSGCHVFNVVDERSYSVRELAEMMSTALGLNRRLRHVPLFVAKTAALFGDQFTKLTGKNFPITASRLKALLEETHFSPGKLISTGFSHPQTTERGIQDLATWYRLLRS